MCGAKAATAAPAAPGLSAEAAFLLRFAEEAYAALVEREPDPIEAGERAAVAAGDGAGGPPAGVVAGARRRPAPPR